MILRVYPARKLQGRVNLPASKSYSIRAYLAAALGGRSSIINPSDCDDAVVAKTVGRALSKKKLNSNTFNVKESGTVLRLLLPLLSYRGNKAKIVGEGTLIGRPNAFLLQTLRRMGVEISGSGAKESVPIYLKGGTIRGGKVSIDGSLSSQFISALLMTCPLLSEDTELTLSGKKLVSYDYITMTLQILRRCGIRMAQQGQRRFLIKGRQKYKGLKKFIVPSDYGLAAFLLAGASLVPSRVTLTGNLREDFVQADGAIMPVLRKMGVKYGKNSKQLNVIGPFRLKGGQISLKDAPDLVPIVTVLAMFASGKTRIYDIGHARAKESDRISDLRHELLKVGAKITESQDELFISPQPSYKVNCLLDPHKDHRLAMAFSILGLKVGARIRDIECVKKSYPGFVRDLKLLGAKVSAQ